jgi:hypothetical protein
MSLLADHPQHAVAVEVTYPSLREAAELIGVSASTLSRRDDLVRVPAGREQRIPAAEVLRLVDVYKNVPVGRVAALLVERGQRHDPEVRRALEDEVDQALEGIPPTFSIDSDLQSFLRDAERHLPRNLAAQVKAAVRSRKGAVRSVKGWSPESSD